MNYRYFPSMLLSMKLRVLIVFNFSVMSQALNSSNSPLLTNVEDRFLRGVCRRDEQGWVPFGCRKQMKNGEEKTFHQKTKERCLEHCKSKGSAFAGIQNWKCRCGTPSGPVKKENGCGESWWEVFASKGAYLCGNLNPQIIILQENL